MSYGWISIHRKIQDNLIWNDKPFNRGAAWVDLLLLANHEDKKVLFNGSIIEVKRGEKITSLRKLSERWGWSREKTKNFLILLKSEDMIDFKTDHQKTTYKIVNYNVYQNEDVDKRATEKPLTDTNNNINNYNNVNNNTKGVVESEINLENSQLKELIQLYQSCGFGLITPYSAKVLNDYMERYSFEWVKEAIEISEQNGIRTLAYIRGVLNKKKTAADKPKNNFRKKETYYRPDNQAAGNVNAIAMKKMQQEFEKMKQGNKQ